MELFSKLTTQASRYWSNSTATGRVLTVLSLVLLFGTVIGSAIWSSMPDYKLLRTGITPQLTARIVSVLDTAGIPNRMNYSGTGVLVPTGRWNEANTAIAELVATESSGDITSTGSGLLFPSSPGHNDFVRSREIALKRTIENMRVVRSAEVHLAIPKPSPFRSKRPPTSASIVIDPVPGEVVSRELGLSIVHMVASAVEGLDPEQVTLTNVDGTGMNSSVNQDPASRRREYVRTLESELALKAEDVLTGILGPGKATIRITAEVDDFLDRTITSNQIDSAGKVRTQEKITSSDRKSVPNSGVAGTGSNNNPITNGNSSGGQMAGKEETNETSYDYPRTVETTQQVGGQLKRLSVSATVDVTADDADDGDAPLLTQQQVEDVISKAVGLDTNRGDQIQVLLAEVQGSPVTAMGSEFPRMEQWTVAIELAKHASLALAAVTALLIAMVAAKKLPSINVSSSDEDQRSAKLLADLSTRVEQNPEAVARLLSAWLSQSGSTDSDSELKKAA